MSNRETYHPKRKRKKKRKVSGSRVALLVLLTVGIALFLAGCGYVVNAMATLPSWDPSKLVGSATTQIMDKDGRQASYVFAEQNRTPISFNELPKYLPDAFVALEDNRFYEHHGIDLTAIGRALVANIRGGIGSEGGSTITQQLVKLSFLNSSKTLKRKIQEAMLAFKVERTYSKQEILELYMNRVYFGNGAYGVQTAAQLYFGKDAKNLDLAESAMLAGIVRSPNNYNPIANPEVAKQRQALALEMMVKYNKITPEQAAQAKAEQLKFNQGKGKATYPYPYYTDQVINETETILEQQGISRETTQNLIYRSGLKIYTSLDQNIQKKMEESFANSSLFPPNQNGKQVEGAMVIEQQSTGELVGLVGGRNYSTLRTFNRASQAKRQPGSAIKPLVDYVPALEKGYTAATIQDDVPITIGTKTFTNSDNRYRGLIPMRTAVQYSINTYAVKTLNMIGIDTGYNFAKRLGITSLDPVRDRNLSLALGGITYGISPLEMVGAYSAISNQGVYIPPHTVRKIVDKDGNILYQSHPQKRVVISEQVAYIMTDLLKGVVRGGTGTKAQLGNRPVAGKTGTTSENVDAWFMGYTPEYTGGVWMGFDKEEKMYGTYGGDYPARMWKTVMQSATAGLPVRDFPQPGGIVRATVCSKSGDLPNAFCPQNETYSEIFVQGTAPTETCNVHVQAQICADSGKLATPFCPNKITKVFLKRTPNPRAGDNSEALPTETCPLHTSAQSVEKKVKVKVCTDPRHNGQLFLANVPGVLESGGCPPEFVKEEELPADKVPTASCDLPDHQVKKGQLLNGIDNLLNKGQGNGSNGVITPIFLWLKLLWY